MLARVIIVKFLINVDSCSFVLIFAVRLLQLIVSAGSK